jgi:nicotinamidase-related amidase
MTNSIPQPRSHWLLNRHRSAVLVIDLQEKLVPLIESHERVVWNIRRLLDAAKLFEVPILATEQYPKGLGHTIEAIRRLLPAVPEKSMFSCRECSEHFRRLWEQGVRQLVVVGIEAHVCVLQTVLDLIAMGFELYVIVDAVGSRFAIDRETALTRMRSAGAILTTCESAMFEWCESSADANFKALSKLVREVAPEVGRY